MPQHHVPIAPAIPREEEEYTWIHRAFLQAFQTHALLTLDQIKPLLARINTCHDPRRTYSESDISQPLINDTIRIINAKLEPYEFEIRSMRDQHSHLAVYAFINKASDSLTQLATQFDASEIAYIRRLLDYMFDTNNTRTRETMAVNHALASQLARPRRPARPSQVCGNTQPDEPSQSIDAGISIQQADVVLDNLLNERFLQKSAHGYFSLAPRALIELGAYLKEMYNESEDETENGDPLLRIRDCEGCREIVTYGIRCNNRNCGVRWHDQCANSYYQGRFLEQRKCPNCQTECSGNVYVGERADRVSRGSM